VRIAPIALRTPLVRLEADSEASIYLKLETLQPVNSFKIRGAGNAILRASDAKLRSAGLSRSKLLSLRDLARRTIDGDIPTLAALQGLADEAIIERLTEVRGIGRWTVEMLLIFRLGRPDVLPADDFGIRKGYAAAFKKRALPTPKELAKRGARLGGRTGQFFLRFIGKDSFVLSADVVACLRDAGLEIGENPTSKKDLGKIQAQFNAWAEETGLSLTHLSRICAMSIADKRMPANAAPAHKPGRRAHA